MEKTSFNIFLATIVLGILAFASPTFLPLTAVKTAIIGIGVLISLILAILSRFKTKSLDFPWNPLVLFCALLGLSIIISSSLSVSPYSSFMGKSFGADAGAYLLVMLVVSFLAIMLIRTRDRVLMTYMSIVGSFFLVAVFQGIRLLTGAQFLSFGLFSTVTSTMVGSWFDFGIFAGLAAVLSLLTLEVLPVAKRLRIITILIFILALIFLVIVGFPAVWIALAIVALGIAAKRYLDIRSDPKRTTFFARLPLLSLVVFIAAALFAWQGNTVTVPVVNAIKASYTEVGLPWQYTMDVAEPTLKAVPFFGAGPDRFTDAYLQFKPEAINATQFWSVDFSSGSNFILTSLVTQGLVGFILWIVFLVIFCKEGIRALKPKSPDDLSSYTLAASFFSATFLWLMAILYVPSHAILLLTFVMTGLFIGELIGKGRTNIKTLSWAAGARGRIFVIVLVAAAFLVSLAGIILFLKETVSQAYFQSAIQSINASTNTASTTDVTAAIASAAQAKSSLQKAVAWNNVDTNYQALAQVDVYAVNALIAAATSTSSSSLATEISSLITESVGFARTAERLDPANSYNYLAEANTSETAAGLSIPNGYENGRVAYGKALQVDPFNPSIYLSLAKLDYFAGSTTAAVADLNAALQLKPDYSDALFEAGIISYDQRDYQTAEAAFAQTVKDDPTNVNAIYFLSLSLARLGDTKDAIIGLTSLSQAYPDNAQIIAVLGALKAGKSPFADAQTSSPPVKSASSTPTTH
jgi:tetratricopeptide (TPR) repeat protein/O-antigen ligase